MNDNFLSPDGRARRSEILQLAIREARRHRRRRRIAPAASIAIILVIGAVALILRSPTPKAVLGPVPVAIARAAEPPASQPAERIEYLVTDSTITDRLSTKPGPPRWTNIGDDRLLAELAAAGQPAGLVYLNGRAILFPSTADPSTKNKGTGTISAGN
jgi:hypothetical protein